MNEPEPTLETLQQQMGFHFKRPALLQLALTHPSARTELNLDDDNQRLEFIGDAVLGLLAAEYGFVHFPDLDEGALTTLRSAVTRTGTLADIGRELGLGPLMVFGRGEAAGGGARKARNLADATEALAGAVYLDGGLPAARVLFERVFASRINQPSVAKLENPKGQLQELIQKRGLPLPEYKVLAEEGPPHQPHFVIQLRIGNQHEATGSGPSKRSAESDAAAKLLQQIR